MTDIVLDQNSLGHLQYFCIFVGYPNSGHSLVGSIIDAHPNAVISHELHIGKLLKRGLSKEQIFSMIVLNSIQFAKKGRTWNNYSYEIPGEWNGRFKEILVIGDKKGSQSVAFFSKKTERFDMLTTSFDVPVKYVHVIRNPYDIISTLHLKTGNGDSEKKKRHIDRIMSKIYNVERIRETIQSEQWLDIYHEQFIASPAESIQTLFDFFNLTVPDGFFDHCKEILFKSPHQSRFDIEWTEEEIEFVAGKLSEIERFSSYNYYR